MNISCEIIKDLLPLYHDQVCSEESNTWVKAHLSTCETCSHELQNIDEGLLTTNVTQNEHPIKLISKKWKNDKKFSFLKGTLTMSLFAGMACFIAYNLNGSYIAQDGTLIESFGYIPIGFLCFFIALLSGISLGIIALKKSR